MTILLLFIRCFVLDVSNTLPNKKLEKISLFFFILIPCRGGFSTPFFSMCGVLCPHVHCVRTHRCGFSPYNPTTRTGFRGPDVYCGTFYREVSGSDFSRESTRQTLSLGGLLSWLILATRVFISVQRLPGAFKENP